MNRILIPVDGSQSCLHAVEYLIKRRARYSNPRDLEIHLLNVQHPFSSDVSAFVDAENLREHHHDQGLKALESARGLLDGAGAEYQFHVTVGEPAEVIARFARDRECDEILMGTRGLGAVAGLLMGSVAMKVAHLANVPVMLVK